MTPGEVRETAHAYFAARVDKTQAQDRPTYALIAGQPGAGKSSAGELVRDELAAQGGFIHIDADRMRERIDTRGSKPTSKETQADAGRLVGALRTETLGARRNALEEGTFRNTLDALSFVEARKADGYRVELVAVATPSAESLLGIYQRHEYQHAYGAHNPRFVEKSYHDMAMSGFVKSVDLVGPLVDRARVITRDGATLYDSSRKENEHGSAAEALRVGQKIAPERVSAVQNGWALVDEMARARGADPAYLVEIQNLASAAAALSSAQSVADPMRGAHGLANPARTAADQAASERKFLESKGVMRSSGQQAAPQPETKAQSVADPMRGAHGLANPARTAADQAAAILKIARERGIAPKPQALPTTDKSRDKGPDR